MKKIFIAILAILALLILNFSSYSDVSIDFFDNLQYAQYKNPDEWSYVLQVATYLYYFEKKILRKSESSIILLNTNKLPYIKSIKIKGERKNEI